MSAYITTARRAALLALVAFAAACSDSSAPIVEPPPGGGNPGNGGNNGGNNGSAVASISITGDREIVEMYAGQLQGTALKADGSAADAQVSYASSNTAIVTIDATGAMRAVAPGSATITASAGGKSLDWQVTVQPRQATTIELGSSFNRELMRGDTLHFQVLVHDQKGQLMPQAAWTLSVSDPTVIGVVSTVPFGTQAVVPIRTGASNVTIVSGGASLTKQLRVAAETRYPLRELNGKALPAVMLETSMRQGEATIKRQLVLAEGSLTLSNSSDRFTQRMVIEEWEITELQGNTIKTKLATNVSETKGSYNIDATGHTVLFPDDNGPSVIGTTVGMYGIRLVEYQAGKTFIYEFWR